MTDNTREVVLSTRFGYGLRFHEETVRVVGRNASGVIGMRFQIKDDTVCAITLVDKAHTSSPYPMSGSGNGPSSTTSAGMEGERGCPTWCSNAMPLSSSRGPSQRPMRFRHDRSGVVIRTPVSDFRIIGRGTKGVHVMRLDENDKVVGIAIVPAEMKNGDGQEPDEKNDAN